MPYKAPNADFFDKFTDDLLAKVEQKPQREFSLMHRLAPALSIAAALAVIVTVSLNVGRKSQDSFLEGEYVLSESVDDSIDSYLNSLTDEEIAYLAVESSCNDDFFSNLPDNN